MHRRATTRPRITSSAPAFGRPPTAADTWHRHGVLELTAAARRGRTVVTAQRTAFPAGSVRISAVDGDGVPELQLTNPSGGLLAGDRMDTVIDVDPGARLSVVTQGANRVCGTAPDVPPRTTTLDTRLAVGDGAIVEWLPHHLVPYARSCTHQRTNVELGAGAGLLLWDVITTGRSGRGERCLWERVDSRLRIATDGRPLLVDGAILTTDDEPFDGADVAAVFVVVLPAGSEPDSRAAGPGPGDRAATDRLADALHATADGRPGTIGSASALDDRVVAGRLLARDTVAAYATLNAWRAPARAALGLPPAAREIG